MPPAQERILLIENNPQVSDIIARQTLAPLGYQVEVVTTAATAIQDTARLYPDLILCDLKLPGLSGKDFLVALASQGMEIPVIILAEKGMESDVIQAFRLGATDYLLWPMREPEIVSAVERVLKQVQARREREALGRKLNQANQELQRRVRELTAIFAIGKAVTSVTDPTVLMEKIVEGAVYTAEADSGWLLVREDDARSYILGAQRGLPDSIAGKAGQAWDDGISPLVALSGEPLSLHGEPLQRFKIARLGKSALIMPVKVKGEVIGLLTVVRKAPRPFGPNLQALLGAVADYASISIVNARLFKALKERALSLQKAMELTKANEHKKDAALGAIRNEIELSLQEAGKTISSFLDGEAGQAHPAWASNLHAVQENLQHIEQALKTLPSP